jgi:hypothetical protein
VAAIGGGTGGRVGLKPMAAGWACAVSGPQRSGDVGRSAGGAVGPNYDGSGRGWSGPSRGMVPFRSGLRFLVETKRDGVNSLAVDPVSEDSYLIF